MTKKSTSYKHVVALIERRRRAGVVKANASPFVPEHKREEAKQLMLDAVAHLVAEAKEMIDRHEKNK